MMTKARTGNGSLLLATTFIDAYRESPIQTAENIRQNGIDILVDINVHTLGNRLLIQLCALPRYNFHYLGFPGTSGGFLYDYLIADRFVIPPEETAHYTEKSLTYRIATSQATPNAR